MLVFDTCKSVYIIIMATGVLEIATKSRILISGKMCSVREETNSNTP